MDENTSSTPSQPSSQERVQSESSQIQNPRRRSDIAWNYCAEGISSSGKAKALTCIFCNQTINGGGINRMKQHLAGIKEKWWKTFGGDTPHLQMIALRILSQTSVSSGCERNWSVFERIHSKKRNRLEHQRLNDLVFVHYNARLSRRGEKIKHSSPVDYECIDKVDYWIVDDSDRSEELDYNELEGMLEEELTNDANSQPPLGDDLDVINEPIDLRNYDKEVHTYDMIIRDGGDQDGTSSA